jgi:hypothetical protein
MSDEAGSNGQTSKRLIAERSNRRAQACVGRRTAPGARGELLLPKEMARDEVRPYHRRVAADRGALSGRDLANPCPTRHDEGVEIVLV